MANDIYARDERRLLEAWFAGNAISSEDEELLATWGFDHDPCEAYTRLDAWVSAFAVRDIQERLPNCGIRRDDGVVLTRPIHRDRRPRKVAGAIGPDEDWREAVRRVLVDDCRFQFLEWDQSPWACVWRAGLVTTKEAMAWRREAWEGHEEFAEEEAG